MKRLILILGLITSFVYAQSKAGFYVVGGQLITVQDTSSRKYLKAVENAGVVPSIIQNFASNFLVTTEKAIGSYSLMVAQYPFIGGTAATHKFNMNDPRDLDAAFRLTFVGGITHSANGMQGDGSTGYANTNISTSILTYNNTHLSIYSNISNNTGGVDIGSIDQSVSPAFSFLILTNQNGSTYSDQYTYVNSDRISFANVNGLGYFISSRTNLNHKLFRNGIIRASNLSNSSSPFLSRNIFISHPNFYTNGRCGYASAGAGLTDTQAIQQSQIVTFFNSLQGRQ